MSETIDHHFVARHKWMELWTGYNDQPYLRVPAGVYIVPMNYAGEVMMIREPAIHSGEWVLELPGGKIDEGESPSQAANRELQEEIGYKAEVLFPLAVLNPLTRHARWDLHLFLARNLMPSRMMGDEIYQIEIERVPLETFEPLIASGRLQDSSVIAALYMARQFISGKLVVNPLTDKP
ncbi:MAG: NUDIX domain-containing protein [Chloroflexi bacterium]|nr:MAG: NUDIX domain-containing protein [Chloroflexota bacterium]